jgi:2-polyprenyl-3-methyl-5-hydroxy-6-metoxy-1,4-benzoquinol methylase
MVDRYFQDQYAPMNGIDPSSAASIEAWYERLEPFYRHEILTHLPSLPTSRIVDIGCGIGGALWALRRAGYTDLFGADTSASQLDVARRHVSATFVRSDGRSFLRRAPRKWDAVILFDVLEHVTIEDGLGLLQAARRSLRQPGRLILRTPNMCSWMASRMRYVDRTHRSGYTPESLREAIIAAGFSTVRLLPSYAGWSRIAMLRIGHRVFARLHALPPPSVVTENIIAVADLT